MSDENRSKTKLKDMLKDELVDYTIELQKKLQETARIEQRPQDLSEIQKAIGLLVKLQAEQMGVNQGIEQSLPGDAPYKILPWKKIGNMAPLEKVLWKNLNRMEWLRLEYQGSPLQGQYELNIFNMQNKYVWICERERMMPRDDGTTFEDQYAMNDAGEKAIIEMDGKKGPINFSKFYKLWKKQAQKAKREQDEVATKFWGLAPDSMQVR